MTCRPQTLTPEGLAFLRRGCDGLTPTDALVVPLIPDMNAAAEVDQWCADGTCEYGPDRVDPLRCRGFAPRVRIEGEPGYPVLVIRYRHCARHRSWIAAAKAARVTAAQASAREERPRA